MVNHAGLWSPGRLKIYECAGWGTPVTPPGVLPFVPYVFLPKAIWLPLPLPG